MNRLLLSLAVGSIFLVELSSQSARTYRLTVAQSVASPVSNSVNEIVRTGDTLWAGFSKGLALTTSLGASWEHFTTSPLRPTGISGIAVRGRIVWVSGATSTRQDSEPLPTGDGLFRSLDGGSTWTAFAQPVDSGTVDTLQYGINRIAALSITTPINNICYDIAIGPDAVWTANFAGMLRRSVDSGMTWQRVILPPDDRDSIRPTDTLDFDLAPTGGRLNLRGNLNHRVFSVLVDPDSVVWVGTAGGINRSTDGGISWRKFTHQNQALGISGNFVVALRQQRWSGTRTLWAATVNAEAVGEQRGISFTTDDGATWGTALPGEFAHNFAFQDSIVYVATDAGLFRSSDGGVTWLKSGSIVDAAHHQQFASEEIIAVETRGDTVIVGGPEGTAWTVDGPGSPFGTVWTVLRTSLATPATSTYSYPLPFSPDDEVVRLHYATPAGAGVAVTIRIFDFGMVPVRTLLANANRSGGRQFDEIWDGTTDGGRRAANGVYFYRLEMSGMDAAWGKILVIQ